MILFDIALIVPLLTLKAPDTIKITLGVISGSWIPVVGIAGTPTQSEKRQALYQAKAEVDHETLTYLAKLQDEQMTELKAFRKFFVLSRTNNQI